MHHRFYLPAVVALMTTLLPMAFIQNRYSATDDGMTPMSEGLDDDLVVLDIIHSGPALILKLSNRNHDVNEGDREAVKRLMLAVREASNRSIMEARWDLLAIVEACEGKRWRKLSIDVFGALRAMGESQTYLIDQLSRSSERPSRAASALMILGSEPSDELDRIATKALSNCMDLDDGGHGYITMQNAHAIIVDVHKQKRRVDELISRGEEPAAQLMLLRMAWLSYFDPRTPPTLVSVSDLYGPGSEYAKCQIRKHILEDRGGVLAVLESMVWRDFIGVGPEHEEPEDYLEKAKIFREQARSMFPEFG